MAPDESKRPRTQTYLDKVRAALAAMPPMTSSEFYAQMEKSMGKKTAWITSGANGSHTPASQVEPPKP